MAAEDSSPPQSNVLFLATELTISLDLVAGSHKTSNMLMSYMYCLAYLNKTKIMNQT